MKLATDEQDVLSRTLRWTERHDAVREVVLNSSRAIAQTAPAGPVDLLSVNDIALTGAAPKELWTALDRAIRLIRRCAISVGADLGYAYPYEVDDKMVDYLGQIKQLT